MNLINKKLLQQKLHSFELPNSESLANAKKLLEGWQKALKDSDLSKTKEKSVQGKFLSTFFEDILGYSDVTTGNDEWTLIQHPRIENDSKEPDGSLGWFTKDNKITRAVIELKDAQTSLDKRQNRGNEKLTPIEQGYLYATKYEGCNWIIVSNFREIRLYNKNRTQENYEKFDVVDLTQENEFKRFYFLLSKENLLSKDKESIVDVLAKDTNEAEQDITKKFYAHYKDIRLKLLNHLIDNNVNLDKTLLLEKTQKLLDRLIFTLFCEDTSSLLPLNIVKNTYERALSSFSASDERVWNEFKGLFHAIDKGNNQVKPPINAFNGGLFASDTELDSLSIKDYFWADFIELANYDFETDLNVNILGHIFEQSISDLEEIKIKFIDVYENIENGSIFEEEREIQKTQENKGRRKKDGIFYTPEYITRYIVESTVGKYIEEHPEKLEAITILDPACGSGAFLNQAHSYLFNEYKHRHELLVQEKKAKGEAITLFDYNPAANNRAILLNNLFGVDLNQESVEITKLALWLKTATKTEPLQNLDRNIKCGNSLVSEHAVAGYKAFSWNVEFENILHDGGFDVIIGNPPYIFARNNNFTDAEKDYYYSNYELTQYQLNTYTLFLEQAYKLLRTGGYLGFIIPNTWLTTSSFSPVRQFVLDNSNDVEIINIHDKIFADANVDTCLLLLKKGVGGKVVLGEFNNNLISIVGEYGKGYFDTENRIINISAAKRSDILPIVNKINNSSNKLADYAQISTGLKAYQIGKGTPHQTSAEKDNRVFHANEKLSDEYVKYLEGRDVNRYSIQWSGQFLKYGDWLAEPRKSVPFNKPRILVRQIPSTPPYSIQATLVNEHALNDINSMVVFNINEEVDPKALLGVINSRLVSFWFNNTFDKLQRNIFPQFKVNELKTFPIPKNLNQLKLIALVDSIETATIKHFTSIAHIKDFLFTEFGIHLDQNLIKSLGALGWNEFAEIISKQKIKLNVEEKEQLFTWFRERQNELKELQSQIEVLNKKIDNEVYAMYELTADEITSIEQK